MAKMSSFGRGTVGRASHVRRKNCVGLVPSTPINSIIGQAMQTSFQKLEFDKFPQAFNLRIGEGLATSSNGIAEYCIQLDHQTCVKLKPCAASSFSTLV